MPADTLIEEIWGEEPPEAAKNALQTYVSHLRKALGPERIEGRPPGYVLHVDPTSSTPRDSSSWSGRRGRADGRPDRVGRRSCGRRSALWRGPAFADLAAEGSLAGEIARLEELRLAALEDRIAADLALGRAMRA